jgi:tRNA (guanine10-N2)-dimethyltransferase
MGLTVHEQDIEAYTARDQARPKRDAQVGMLPPKLAQIIVNMTVTTTNPLHGSVLLDPFCGTGVILQEAKLMGFDIKGSDLETRMVDYTTQNLSWLSRQPWSNFQLPAEGAGGLVTTADATTYEWSPPPNFIACETYLGRPFSHQPDPETLRKVMQDVDTIHKKFLQNVARQTQPGFRMTIAVPAWHTANAIKHLKTLDSLEELGYNRVKYSHASDKDLVYHREGQIVGRELVTLIRK